MGFCYQTETLRHFIIIIGSVMTESIIGDELVYPQKFNRDDYYFEYFPVTLIQPQTNSDIVT